ncbi:type I restriction enzyme, R subunit [Saccharopolyspora antimicrobica]|uniref:Type I restriction enzyme R subunit n=1 Tax=Saccharopolyspora antimicrobica TaxID=455193 RepID=A0A1I5H098_9PSEU|nr:DEAD/DEAH box helicase family protein [Saccharopolyspora antimicrobica]RKT90047.1 type I restriction enzyme R subunit [Saccharopolyspora antimicrobica]SFO41456.1 type I restriction enzyme, R subunit [Saccharopolyspora antimicrobica]
MSNFGFLQAEWPDLHREAEQAERLAFADPRASAFYSRRVLELALEWVFDADSAVQRPYRSDLAALIAEPTLVRAAGPGLQAKMNVIRLQGNHAVHRRAPVADRDAVRVLAELFHVLYWMARTYSRDQKNLPAPGLQFDTSVIPRPVSAEVRIKKQRELKEQAEKAAAQAEELATERRKAKELSAEIVELQKQIKAAKAANASIPDTHDYNEKETRTYLIDLLLKEAGWDLDKPEDREFPVSGLPESAAPSGNGKVDYVLWDDDGKPLGLVEAKRTTRDARSGQHQAKLYADALEARYGQRPLIFYTNGYDTYFHDDLNYPARQVQGFYTKDQLREVIQRRAGRRSLTKLPINEEIAGRYYQSRAIRRIAESFEQDSMRHALLVMATGTGKTRTVVALTDLMMRAGWASRILFLADRTALVRQATNAFKQHLPGTPVVNLLQDKDPHARVFVSTYPTIMNLINQVDGEGRRVFGPGFFDMVVIDEAHRSIFQKYRSIFDYFDALLVGLTATPKDEIARNTYRVFQLENGVPTDVYSLDEAVNEGFLVPPRAVEVPLKFQRDGIKYDDLPEEEKEEWEALDWGDDGPPAEVSSAELNKYLFNADTVDKVLQTLMKHGLKVDGGDMLGKTIIFAANNKHAEFIAERFDVNYPHHKSSFAQVITHKKEKAQSLIDDFSDPAKQPQIAISVDMLDTGIDVPEVVNLVFFKLVRSKTKFWQMLGRGTRLAPDLFGANKSKDGFYVFDVCQNLEFFRQDMPPAEGNIPPSLTQRLFEKRADLLQILDGQIEDSQRATKPDTDGAHSDAGLRWDLVTRLHDEVVQMNPDNFLVRPHREYFDTFADFSAWLEFTPEAHAKVVDHLAGLPTAFREADDNGEEAKRFDLLALRLQLACLHGDPGYDRLRDQVREIASALLDQTTIPAIKAQQVLLDEISGDEWWQDVTLPMLENMRRKLRGLVRLIEKTKRNPVYTDFEDELGELTSASLSGMNLGTDFSLFEHKIRIYLNTHQDNMVVQKIRRNRQITTADLDALQKVFVDNGLATSADLDVVHERGGLGIFLRSMTGLEREAAVRAFDRFQQGKTFTANQLHFLQVVIDHVCRNGIVEVEALYESPFTSWAPSGPEDLFTDAEVDDIVSVIRSLKETAIASDEVA